MGWDKLVEAATTTTLRQAHRLQPQLDNKPTELCEHGGCRRRGQPCYITADDSEPDGFYCAEHAQEHGFCSMCGQFWGGIEEFDFGNGVCPNCREYMDKDLGYWDDLSDADLFDLVEGP